MQQIKWVVGSNCLWFSKGNEEVQLMNIKLHAIVEYGIWLEHVLVQQYICNTNIAVCMSRLFAHQEERVTFWPFHVPLHPSSDLWHNNALINQSHLQHGCLDKHTGAVKCDGAVAVNWELSCYHGSAVRTEAAVFRRQPYSQAAPWERGWALKSSVVCLH